MYGRETREGALALVASGMSPGAASREMGGSPCARATYRRSASGGARKRPAHLSRDEREEAVRRVLSGERVRDVAERAGVCARSARDWVRLASGRGEARPVTGGDAGARVRTRSAGGLPDDPAGPKAMVLELRSRADLAREMLEIVRKGPGADPAALSRGEQTLLAGRLGPAYSLTFLTRRLGLPASTRHCRSARVEAAAGPDADMRGEVARLFRESGPTHGCRRIRARTEADGRLAHKSGRRIRRVTREEGPAVPHGRRRRRRYDPCDRAADEADRDAVPSLPLREDGTHDFSAPAPNVPWVTDVTEFALPDDPRKACLSPVPGCFDGFAVGWRVALTASAAGLTDPSLEMACARPRPGDAPACHSDRGSQRHSGSWKAVCEANGVTRPMSRKARSPDNARMEGFFGTLKNERFYFRDWSGWTAEEFCDEVDRWMLEHNGCRRKLSLGWMTPMERRMAALAEVA